MRLLHNPLRGQGLEQTAEMSAQQVSIDATKVMELLQHCPVAELTPLHVFKHSLEGEDASDDMNSTDISQRAHNAKDNISSLETSHSLTRELGIDQLYIKDERNRMGLGSFKALGASYVIALAASDKIAALPNISLKSITPEQLSKVLNGQTYICASAGNHGLSVAAGARIFGAKAIIYLSETVPETFAERLRGYGADVVRAGDNYEASMAAAAVNAEETDGVLLSDSSWPGYTDLPTKVMEGYLVIPAETCLQLKDENQPTHIFLQAGVGGIAASATAYFRQQWGDKPTIVIVEPDAAPAVIDSIEAGKPIVSQGPVSNMGRLDCKEPSHIALGCLSREADFFVTISDGEVLETTAWLAAKGMASTPSATAGLAVVQQSVSGDSIRTELGIDEKSRVLVIVTEQA